MSDHLLQNLQSSLAAIVSHSVATTASAAVAAIALSLTSAFAVVPAGFSRGTTTVHLSLLLLLQLCLLLLFRLRLILQWLWLRLTVNHSPKLLPLGYQQLHSSSYSAIASRSTAALLIAVLHSHHRDAHFLLGVLFQGAYVYTPVCQTSLLKNTHISSQRLFFRVSFFSAISMSAVLRGVSTFSAYASTGVAMRFHLSG